MLPWFLGLAALAATLDRDVVEATGQQEVGLRVEAFGRYALIAENRQGTALQLVDRMAGTGPIHGTPGAESGRIDAFLERGEYRLLALSDPAGSGTATLRAVRFQEVGEAQVLTEGVRYESEIDDLQTRTFLVAVEGRRPAAFEVIGRHVADLRLWSEDGWLREERARCVSHEPAPGQPVSRCTLTAQLEPGVYQLAVYGGPSRPWTEDSPDRALSVQWGFEELGTAVRQIRRLPSTGIERLLSQAPTDTFRVRLPERAPLQVSARVHQPGNPYVPGGTTAQIHEESRVPEAVVTGTGQDRPKLVTITGQPGQTYVLDALPSIGERATVEGSGRYLVATLHAASPSDVADPTGLLLRRGQQVVAGPTQAVPLAAGQAWSRSFNLLQPTVFLLDVQEAETYAFSVEGVSASLRVEPFLVTKPREYEAPPWSPGTLTANLSPGLHVLSLEPGSDAGVATVTARPNSWSARARELAFGTRKATPLRPNLQWLDIALDRGAPFELVRMPVPGVPTGLVVRQLPLDPVDPVPLSLLPGEELKLPIRAAEAGEVQALTATGEALPIRLGADGPWQPRLTVSPEQATLWIRNPGQETALISLIRHRPPPEPALASFLGPLAPRTSLKPSSPLPLDLAARQEVELELEVPEDGLYVVETTGLLATSGAIRTRTVTSLASGDRNGAGRNLRVARYLREGTYLVRIQTEEESAGHLNVVLRRTHHLDGGPLRDGAPARASVPADTAVAYTFTVEQAGVWRVRSFGRGGALSCRLEDIDGWPIGTPERACDLSERLEPGRYRVILLPEAMDTRRLTLVERERDPLERVGHGPHRLPLDEQVSHTWREGEGRPADVWTFTLPADATVRFELSDDMAGELFGPDGPLDRLVPGRPLRVDLSRGDYRVEVRAARPHDRVRYTLRAVPSQLVPGLSRSVRAPGQVELSIGASEVVEITSFGTTDVRGRLLDARGELVAANDDRPDDWNFRIAERLAPGRYTLQLDALEGGGATLLRVHAPEEAVLDPLPAGRSLEVKPGDKTVVVPIRAGDAEVLVASAIAGEPVELAVEVQVDGVWRPAGSDTASSALVAARVGGRPARVRVRALDLRGSAVQLEVHAPHPHRTRSDGRVGLRSGKAPVGLAHLDAAPGLLVVEDPAGLLHCPARPGPCEPVRGLVPIPEGGAWLLGTQGAVKARRLRLEDRVPVSLSVPGNAAPGWEPSGDDRFPASVRHVDLGVSGPVAVVARASAGQPGLTLGARRDQFAVGRRAALGIAFGDGPHQAALWSADGGPLRTTIQAVSLEPEAARPLEPGLHSFTLEPGQAVRLHPTDAVEIHAALEPGLALVSGDAVGWADQEPRQLSLPASGEVWLVQVGERPGRAVLEVQPGGRPWRLADGPLERVYARGGAVRVEVPALDDLVGPDLHVRGAVGEPVYVRADGLLRQGARLEAGPGGVLWIPHGAGPVLAWLGDAPPVEGQGPRTVVEQATAVPLSGASHTFEVRSSEPSLLQLRADCPVVVEIIAGEVRRTEVRQHGGDVLAYLPNGQGTIHLRALKGASLYGEAALTPSRPLDAGEGHGPEILLPAGGAHAFRFVTERESRVGIGVRAAADRVSTTLLDGRGRLIGGGAAHMPELPAGTWILVLSQPADAPPVRVRPSLVGVDAPDTGPPADVVRTYVEGEPR